MRLPNCCTAGFWLRLAASWPICTSANPPVAAFCRKALLLIPDGLRSDALLFSSDLCSLLDLPDDLLLDSDLLGLSLLDDEALLALSGREVLAANAHGVISAQQSTA